MKVPFLDLKAQYESIKEEVAAAIQQVLDKTAFAGGPFVAQFEKEFAAFCKTQYSHRRGKRHGRAVAGPSGPWGRPRGRSHHRTGHVHRDGRGDQLLRREAGVRRRGREDVQHGLLLARNGHHPPKPRRSSPSTCSARWRTWIPILEIARKHKLFVVEDAAQAHGAEYKGRIAGSVGDAGCFSFYPGKNLGAYGEAGAIVTNNGDLDKKIRMLRDHGQAKKYYHDLVGWNARMDGFQGAILSVKLKHLTAWNEARRRNAKRTTRFWGRPTAS